MVQGNEWLLWLIGAATFVLTAILFWYYGRSTDRRDHQDG
jgi:cytochrome c-type biogenesis protein CcmH/NrfF